jgi:hypothetical protein
MLVSSRYIYHGIEGTQDMRAPRQIIDVARSTRASSVCYTKFKRCSS